MQAFRATACRQEGCCEMCGVMEQCPYNNTFSQALSDDPAAVKRHQKPPLPFAFDLPLLPAFPNKGREVEIGLTLAGTAINYVADYVASVRYLFENRRRVRNVSGKIIRVESHACAGFRSCIMNNGDDVALDNVSTISGRELVEMNTLEPDRIKLTILSPMRIPRDGHFLHEFSFSPFLRSLLRRISSLAYYYYRCENDVDYKWLANASGMVQLAENDFQWKEWQKSHGMDRLAGIVGSGYCTGMPEEFRIFLLLGEYFNAGKGAAFGLGRFRIDKISGV